MTDSKSKQANTKAAENQSESQSIHSGLSEVLITTLLIFALLGVIVLLYFGTLRYRAELYHSQAIDALRGSNGSLRRAQTLESKAIGLASFEDRYHRTSSQIFLARLNEMMNNQELSEAQRRQQFQTLMAATINQARTATDISKRNVANWSNQGSIYHTLMNYAVQDADKWAVNSYQKAMELAPISPDLHVSLARVYLTKAGNVSQEKKDAQKIKQQNLTSAMDHLEKAVKLKPNYWPAHFQQVVVYDRQGKSEQAIEKLKTLKRARPQDATTYFQLGALYFRNEDFEKAEQEFKQILKQNSKFANARYFLGLVYDKQGKKQKALEQFEEIISLDESNKKQVQSIIDNIKAGKPALGEQEQPQQMPNLEGSATTTPATTTPQE